MSSICAKYIKSNLLSSTINEEPDNDFRYKTIAVVGSKGCGKTTWINNFIASKGQQIQNKQYYQTCNIITAVGMGLQNKVYWACNFIECDLESVQLEEVDAVLILIDCEKGYENKDMSKVRSWLKNTYLSSEYQPQVSVAFTKNDKHNIKCRPIIIKSFWVSMLAILPNVTVSSINNFNGLNYQQPLKQLFAQELNTNLVTIFKNTN
jgi:GTP-binding protein EngB required for normal cell division